METGNFNLDEAIKKHVKQLQGKGSLTGADASELSSHLYDATEALMKQQLTTEEAFIISAKRLGSEEVLHNEYSKVNPTLNVNRIWAYLILGFNLIYAIPGIAFVLWLGVSKWALHTYSVSATTTIIVTALNIALCVAIVYAVLQKHNIARFIERSVENRALRTVTWSFLPLTTTVVYNFFLPRFAGPRSSYVMMSDFGSKWVEMSFYLLCITFAMAALSLVVSITRFEKVTVKSLLTKPGITFLVLGGIIVELLAASTRTIQFPRELSDLANSILSAAIFGSVYLLASLVIAYYNSQSQWRYLFFFAAGGFILETSVGINADLSRGNTYYTAFFATALILGVLGGKLLGNLLRRNRNIEMAKS